MGWVFSLGVTVLVCGQRKNIVLGSPAPTGSIGRPEAGAEPEEEVSFASQNTISAQGTIFLGKITSDSKGI